MQDIGKTAIPDAPNVLIKPTENLQNPNSVN